MDGVEELVEPKVSWQVKEADEAKYNFSDQKGVWQPKPEDILSMFEQLAKGGSLPLKWTCPGRRTPESDTPKENDMETEMEVEDDPMKQEYCDPEISAFDFDDIASDASTKVTPMRSHTGVVRTPKTEKRVARMDNIMDSLRKQQIQRAAEREAARKNKAGTPSRAQQGRGRLIKFGSSSPSTSKRASPVASNNKGPTTTTSSPSSSTNLGAENTSTDAVTSSDSATVLSSNNVTTEVSAPVMTVPTSLGIVATSLKTEAQETKADTLDEMEQKVDVKTEVKKESVISRDTSTPTPVTSFSTGSTSVSSSLSAPTVSSESSYVSISSNPNGKSPAKMLGGSLSLAGAARPDSDRKSLPAEKVSSAGPTVPVTTSSSEPSAPLPSQPSSNNPTISSAPVTVTSSTESKSSTLPSAQGSVSQPPPVSLHQATTATHSTDREEQAKISSPATSSSEICVPVTSAENPAPKESSPKLPSTETGAQNQDIKVSVSDEPITSDSSSAKQSTVPDPPVSNTEQS